MNRELRKKLAKNEESKQESQSAKMMTIKNKLAYQDLIKKKNLELKKDNLNFLNAKFVLQNQINELEKVVEVQNRNLLLVQSEAHELRNQLTLIEPTLRKLSGLESTTEALSRALLTWDDDLRRFRESRSQITRLMGQWKLSESMAASWEETNGGLRAAVQSLQATVERLTTENQLLRARALSPSPDALRAAALRADHLAARLQRAHEVNARLRAALVGLDSDPVAPPALQDDHLSDDPAQP